MDKLIEILEIEGIDPKMVVFEDQTIILNSGIDEVASSFGIWLDESKPFYEIFVNDWIVYQE